MPKTASGPLTGKRVLDLTIWVQGPVTAMLLGDLGADVVKIEKAGGGDFSRSLSALNGVPLAREGQPNFLWHMCNRNKRTVALDLANPASRPIFEQLVREADVLVTNLHIAALRKLAITREAIHAINPGIVYARAAGLGDRGPRSEDPTQDTVGMAYGGFMWTSASSPDVPYYPPGAMADVLAGTTLAFGVLAALLERDRTGEGQYVCSSQLQALMWLQYLNLGVAANFGQSFGISDRENPTSALVNTYRCGDARWIALGLILESHWPPFCEAVGLDHLPADERFTRMGARIKNAVVLARILEGHFLQRPSDYWLERLRAADLWVAPVNSALDLASGDPQVEANGYLRTFADGWRMPAGPFSLGTALARAAPAPDYGQDTDSILAEAGLNAEEILDLRVQGAIW